jgi:hypothetical protein
MKLLLSVFFATLLASCAGLPQNIQSGNQTGKVEDNRWDYFNGQATHYTSTIRSLYKDSLRVRNESTDSFSAAINIQKGRDVGVIDFNGKLIKLTRTDDKKYDDLIERFRDRSIPKERYKAWSDYYSSEDGRLIVAVEYAKQIVLTSFEEGDTIQQISYYPSRYLACKKIAAVKAQNDKRIAAELLRTALVAGIQSYTSYSRTTVYDSYGNFGYGVTRDYSWAGDRAGDALSTLFAGQYSESGVQTAWQSLNCW